ncbi:dienelactone hydrolase family protein [Marinobacter sediminum]|uniref:dienelactone hydrolase family protein n=1 Tax=Marinobacter sediminum TaxID=256323 RepID=UPI00193A0642|nr:dienelactone hydrolase family protein [Marinobacter sediminum]
MRYPLSTAVLTALTLVLIHTQAGAEMHTETIDYKVGDQTFTGYLAWDTEYGQKRPGVLLVHEWWGHNQFVREQAEQLAAAGYTAFALDMYGSGKLAQHPDTAKQFMQEATSQPEQVKARFVAAMELLQNHESVDSSRIAAQGYCFGGAVVLNMARLGLDLDGVVSFHGSLASPIKAEPGQIKARIQVYTGGADPFVPTEQVAGLVTEMQQAEADLTLVSFPGVQHSFTNPSADAVADEFDIPLAYNESAATRSWQGTMAFYQEIFNLPSD